MPELSLARDDFEALAADILAAGHTLRFRARGTSMRPFIRDGNILEIRPAGVSPIRCGDVVLCCNDSDRVVVHRIVGQENGHMRLLIQGDALTRPDGRISRDQVLGKVVVIERGKRRIDIDTGLPRLSGLLWVKFSPFSVWLYRVLVLLGATAERVILVSNGL